MVVDTMMQTCQSRLHGSPYRAFVLDASPTTRGDGPTILFSPGRFMRSSPAAVAHYLNAQHGVPLPEWLGQLDLDAESIALWRAGALAATPGDHPNDDAQAADGVVARARDALRPQMAALFLAPVVVFSIVLCVLACVSRRLCALGGRRAA